METNVYYIGNSGLFFYRQGTGLLVDGLFGRGPYQCFSPFPDGLHKEMVHRRGLFAHLDALLFSHSHGDHMDQDMLYYVKTWDSQPGIYAYGCSGNTLCAQTEKDRKRIEIEGFEIVLIAAEHEQGKEQNDIFNVPTCMVLLKTSDENILLTSDVVLGEREAEIVKNFGSIDAVFCNPLQLVSEQKRMFFQKIMPRRIFIVHLPDVKDDYCGYRELAEQESKHLIIHGAHPEIPGQLQWIDGKAPKWAERT